MIFVTLGTQDKSFYRLLEELEKQIKEGIIKDEVIVQAGATKFQSSVMNIFDYIDMAQFDDYLKKSDLIITHGGVGSILTSLKLGKKVIAVARLQEYDEHENDHQLEIVSKFRDFNYIIGCLNVCDLRNALLELDTFSPSQYISNNEHFCDSLEEIIEKL